MIQTPDDHDGARLRYGAAPQRRAAILAQLRRTGHVSVSDVSQQLAVSEMTVRRDLRELAANDLAVLVHGGASLPPHKLAHPEFTTRAMINGDAKTRIGRAAAALASVHDTVGIDAGTTAFEVASALPDEFVGCVVTPSVPVLALMLQRPRARAIAIGGELSHDNQALVAPLGSQHVADLRVSILMLGTTSIDTRGIYVRSELELGAKRALLEAADRVVLVCDSSKEGAIGTVRVCGIERIDTLVTDAPLSPALTTRLHESGTRVVIA